MKTPFQNLKALVVDNSSIITKIIKNFLVKAGFDKSNIFVAHDRNQAMMMFELESFDLITSGIHLKDTTGIDLLNEIREKNNAEQNQIPFLIISSEKQETYQEELNVHHASNYLRKPFNQDQFQTMIGSMLSLADSIETTVAEPSAPNSQWQESPVVFPPLIINAFAESTIEAMEQYMAEAIPDNSSGSVELNGYFSAWVDLLNSENRIQITVLINFPKKAACGIYEEIFGEVDIEQVCGVVQELANIIGGIVKPKILEFSKEIIQLVHEGQELPTKEDQLTWDLGLPESKMGENHSLDIKVNKVPKFHIPFKVKDETFHVVVLTQTY
jgi:DNA-binding response OmpR family regulator